MSLSDKLLAITDPRRCCLIDHELVEEARALEAELADSKAEAESFAKACEGHSENADRQTRRAEKAEAEILQWQGEVETLREQQAKESMDLDDAIVRAEKAEAALERVRAVIKKARENLNYGSVSDFEEALDGPPAEIKNP